MRIIQEEETVLDTETKKVCYKCRTQLSYIKADLEMDRGNTYVRCPTCSALLLIK